MFIVCLSRLFVILLSGLPAPDVIIKAAVDFLLFFASYFVQKNWVFRKNTNKFRIFGNAKG